MKRRRSNLVGYRVVGRHGELGVVVDDERMLRGLGDETIVVRGGISNALVYHVPTERLRRISAVSRTVTVEVDVADFVPRLAENGTVELHVGR